MCLFVNIKMHKQLNGGLQAKKAKHNTKVQKIFYIEYCGILCTPYMEYKIKESDIIDGMSADYMRNILKWDTRINVGIHAYVNNSNKVKEALLFSSHYFVVDMYIPKGAYYWYGMHDDIVAEKMCFYKKDQKRLLKLIKEE